MRLIIFFARIFAKLTELVEASMPPVVRKRYTVYFCHYVPSWTWAGMIVFGIAGWIFFIITTIPNFPVAFLFLAVLLLLGTVFLPIVIITLNILSGKLHERDVQIFHQELQDLNTFALHTNFINKLACSTALSDMNRIQNFATTVIDEKDVKKLCDDTADFLREKMAIEAPK